MRCGAERCRVVTRGTAPHGTATHHTASGVNEPLVGSLFGSSSTYMHSGRERLEVSGNWWIGFYGPDVLHIYVVQSLVSNHCCMKHKQ